jgi:hypothetical protein
MASEANETSRPMIWLSAGTPYSLVSTPIKVRQVGEADGGRIAVYVVGEVGEHGFMAAHLGTGDRALCWPTAELAVQALQALQNHYGRT